MVSLFKSEGQLAATTVYIKPLTKFTGGPDVMRGTDNAGLLRRVDNTGNKIAGPAIGQAERAMIDRVEPCHAMMCAMDRTAICYTGAAQRGVTGVRLTYIDAAPISVHSQPPAQIAVAK